jgi:cation-transporting ATPase E/undecaprenyl-diphosphatase
MVPEGLVLLTSIAFAVGVVRLGRRRVLVQELPAVEVLSRVDVLCLDKTGTLTEGSMAVAALDVLAADHDRAADALGAVAAAEPAPNASARAIAAAFAPPEGWAPAATVPFSSARKWSAVSFGDRGWWVLGAPGVLLDGGRVDDRTAHDIDRRVAARAAAGQRVLLLACAGSAPPGGRTLPSRLEPVALVVLEDRVRPEAAGTLAFFQRQGVAIKVLSGDDPRTVDAVARRVGVPGAGGDAVDARELPTVPDGLADVAEATTVFGRVSPQQKPALVDALKARGHVVAMVGDGVNDVLALKRADLGIAIGSGSAAARAVAQVVLLDSSFDALPSVVAEGRRVIANIERVAKLFLTKTVYATVLALAVGVARLPFPFLPRHLTVVTGLTIGIPAFFLALAPNASRAQPGFVRRALAFAIPAGLVAAVATFVAYAGVGIERVTLAGARSTATIVLFSVGFWALTVVARPLTGPRRMLLTSMACAFACVLLVRPLREFYGLTLLPARGWLTAAVVSAAGAFALESGWEVATHWASRRRWSRRAEGPARNGSKAGTAARRGRRRSTP